MGGAVDVADVGRFATSSPSVPGFTAGTDTTEVANARFSPLLIG
jgi:hypothetical protein